MTTTEIRRELWVRYLRLADLIAFSVDPATPGARDELPGWITDGYGNYWRNCPDCSRMEVVRQGKAQCHC